MFYLLMSFSNGQIDTPVTGYHSSKIQITLGLEISK
ncbi:MAG: hypothetical protein FD155_3303 [Bacteroidetes bacterium]|nr:MAG: hypothetical protein FD155_3303 [Bacteroidota bacterium]